MEMRFSLLFAAAHRFPSLWEQAFCTCTGSWGWCDRMLEDEEIKHGGLKILSAYLEILDGYTNRRADGEPCQSHIWFVDRIWNAKKCDIAGGLLARLLHAGRTVVRHVDYSKAPAQDNGQRARIESGKDIHCCPNTQARCGRCDNHGYRTK
ncbi:hypothetical protein CC78DRAFT_373059 [Lojkania enalia]|uniref:Uncharacterized protein n=1 Tax=Lojkania enalia TaxID=147567 RepID=A0A9P4KJM2_9PLEO|nr:hypothetical protein CC78DRAFT_373059 [Didymosphaeria enalia]